jgi:hypothetical protein
MRRIMMGEKKNKITRELDVQDGAKVNMPSRIYTIQYNTLYAKGPNVPASRPIMTT